MDPLVGRSKLSLRASPGWRSDDGFINALELSAALGTVEDATEDPVA